MLSQIITAPFVELFSLETVFIELTSKNCNLKCKHCYIDVNTKIKQDDFIGIDSVKNCLESKNLNDLKNICLTGGEPLLHPQFNQILRMCLKKANTTIMTNGVCINDKKARFFRKVENETVQTQIDFRISITNFDEKEDDKLRGRGSFRKSINAFISLMKNDFNPTLIVVNYFNLDKDKIIENFQLIFEKYSITTCEQNYIVIPFFDKSGIFDDNDCNNCVGVDNFDCKSSRILTKSGVYNCPMLSGDYRGKSGVDFDQFSPKSHLESQACIICKKNGGKIFTL